MGLVDGELVLCDEVLTPDSSRFWPTDAWVPGTTPPSFDKQPVRDYLDGLDWDKTPPPPALPAEVVEAASDRYIEAYERITGRSFADWPVPVADPDAAREIPGPSSRRRSAPASTDGDHRPGHRQEGWELRFGWGTDGLQAIGDGAAAVVIVDVLRFTSAVSVAVTRGAEVLPYVWTIGDAARAYAQGNGAELAGGREDGAWSLSPTDLGSLPAGSRLVLPSPNGSALSFRACDDAPGAMVLAGCSQRVLVSSWRARGGPVA